MYRLALGIGFLMTPAVLGCAGNVAGAHPSDMSQQQHEAVAASHEHAAAEHGGKYDAKALNQVDDCAQYLGSCWGSNPTDGHNEEADEHRRVAAAHHDAARALAEADTKACQGVSERDRDISPFLHREAITEVKPLTRKFPANVYATTDSAVEQPVGATIVLSPAAGVTAERLQLIIQCHIARNMALGNDQKEMPLCPLVPKGVTATVVSTGDGFAVNVQSEDKASAAEVLRRARLLLPR